MTTSETLIKARHLIAQGWCQRDSFTRSNGQDHYCMLGAIDKAGFERGGLVEILKIIGRAMGPKHQGVSIPEFNDAPVRTKAEVLEVMDDAIELAKQEEPEQ